MITLESELEGRIFELQALETIMKPMGYSIGGNWDYEHGYFDYKLANAEGYQFLRLPFNAVDGQLDTAGVTVAFQKPFLLSHVYEADLDREGNTGFLSGSFNQFAEPVDKDADFPDAYTEMGKSALHQLERRLLQ